MTNIDPSSKKIKVNQHPSYGVFTLLGLLLPIVGIILGIIYLAKPDKLDKKVGEHAIVMSIVGFGLGFILLHYLIGGRTYRVETSIDLNQFEPYQSPAAQQETEKTENSSKETTSATSDDTDQSPTLPTSSEAVSQKNAVVKAKSYLGYSAFSHDGLVVQLEYEQFSHADAVYGADNSGANWNEQAAKKAKSYMEYSAFSRGGLIDQLLYEKFTQGQAEYGADAVGL